MERRISWWLIGVFLVASLWVSGALAAAPVSEAKHEWNLVNPVGEYGGVKMKLAPRPATLEGKTVGLKWNAKPNGNTFLDRVAELLAKRVPGVKVIKFYEKEPSTAPQSINAEVSRQKAKVIASYKPDIVIGSQCD